LCYVSEEYYLQPVAPNEEIEVLIEMLVEIVAALDETVTERDLYRKMYEQEESARLAIASELETAQKTIKRLNFYLENT
jgi:hypothetical protein